MDINLPKLGNVVGYPSRSVQVLFSVGANIKTGHYYYNCNKWYVGYDGKEWYYLDQVIEWWPVPELGSGNKLNNPCTN